MCVCVYIYIVCIYCVSVSTFSVKKERSFLINSELYIKALMTENSAVFFQCLVLQRTTAENYLMSKFNMKGGFMLNLDMR